MPVEGQMRCDSSELGFNRFALAAERIFREHERRQGDQGGEGAS